MAVYKVIQDIEAEDKLLGPLTLKGFIYALIAGTLAFINFRLLLSGGPVAIRLTVILFLFFPMALFALLAAPIGRDQPTEVWILSHVRFFLKPRKRLWDQTGISQLVTITVPKKVEKQLTKGFSQTEVKSRLQALAATLDSRGWAVKMPDLDISGQPDYFQSGAADSDRLVGASAVATPGPVIDIHAADDIFEQDNATAQKFSNLMQQADVKRKKSILERLNLAREKGVEIQNGPTPAVIGQNPPLAKKRGPVDLYDTDFIPDAEPGEASLHERHPHFATKPSLEDQRRQAVEAARQLEQQRQLTTQRSEKFAADQSKKRQLAMTEAARAANMNLAQSGSAFSLATVSKMANRQPKLEQITPNEAVITIPHSNAGG